MNRNTRITLVALLAVGTAGWAGLAAKLKKDDRLDFKPNALHLKGSPYGRTLALAMRGPADVYWHRGEGGDDHDHSGCDHEHGECQHDGCDHEHDVCLHDHSGCDHEEGVCDHEQSEPEDAGAALASMVTKLAAEHAEHEAHHHEEHADHEDDDHRSEHAGVRHFLLDQIADMRKAYHSRNNQRGESALHRAFVMGETERRLALSYEMDPTNIACYGSYFMFLSEALTRVEGSAGEKHVIRARQLAALRLSNYTVRYCLRYPDEAPAMVTAAVAAHDYLQIQLSVPDPDLEEAAEVLRILDKCIGNYELIRETMIESGTWQNFPEHRRGDMEKAYRLVTVLRDADRTIMERLSGQSVAAPEAPADAEMATR